MKRVGTLLFGLIVGLLVGAAAIGWLRVGHWWNGADPVSIADASLQSVRREARLTVFAARFVAVVSSEQDRFLLSARKTLILPGTVRYDIDLTRLSRANLQWNAATRTLTITLPPIEPSAPAVDLAAAREYSGGGILMALTDAEHSLDSANRAAAVKELSAQARAPLPMGLARQAAQDAVARSFALPLKAAGIDAKLVAVLPG